MQPFRLYILTFFSYNYFLSLALKNKISKISKNIWKRGVNDNFAKIGRHRHPPRKPFLMIRPNVTCHLQPRSLFGMPAYSDYLNYSSFLLIFSTIFLPFLPLYSGMPVYSDYPNYSSFLLI